MYQTHSSTAQSPSAINKHVEAILDTLNAEFDPAIIPVRVEKGKIDNCYNNVAEKVKRDGGKVQYGWVVWQSAYICEAEHHAVWVNDDNDMIDITPRTKKHVTVMFIPDDSSVYTGQYFDNVRVNISKSQFIDDMIDLQKGISQLLTLGERMNDEQLSLPPEVNEHIEEFKKRGSAAEYSYLTKRPKTDECLCGSSKSYIDCCGKDVKLSVNEIVEAMVKKYKK